MRGGSQLFYRPAHSVLLLLLCFVLLQACPFLTWTLINSPDDCTVAHPYPSCSARSKNLLLVFWTAFFHISACQSMPFYLLNCYLVSQTLWSSAGTFFFFLPSTDIILLFLKQRERTEVDLAAYSIILIQKSVVLSNTIQIFMVTYCVHVRVIKWHLMGSDITFPYLKSRRCSGLQICRLPCRAQILLVIYLIHRVQVVLIPPKNNLSYFLSFPDIKNITQRILPTSQAITKT